WTMTFFLPTASDSLNLPDCELASSKSGALSPTSTAYADPGPASRDSDSATAGTIPVIFMNLLREGLLKISGVNSAEPQNIPGAPLVSPQCGAEGSPSVRFRARRLDRFPKTRDLRLDQPGELLRCAAHGIGAHFGEALAHLRRSQDL